MTDAELDAALHRAFGMEGSPKPYCTCWVAMQGLMGLLLERGWTCTIDFPRSDEHRAVVQIYPYEAAADAEPVEAAAGTVTRALAEAALRLLGRGS